jgi:hypothetical protein
VEGVLEIRFRFLDLGIATQDDKSSNDNEEQGGDLDESNRIRQVVGVFGVKDQGCLVSLSA